MMKMNVLCSGSAHMTRQFSVGLSLLSGCVLHTGSTLVEWFLCPDGFRVVQEAPFHMW